MQPANDGSQRSAFTISRFITGLEKQTQMKMHSLEYLGMHLRYKIVKRMDKGTVQATMTKAEDSCAPQGQPSVISLAAQFFAPDYAPKMSIREWRKEAGRGFCNLQNHAVDPQ